MLPNPARRLFRAPHKGPLRTPPRPSEPRHWGRPALIHPDLLAVIVCPESRQPLSLAADDLLARVNAAVEKGGVTNVGGDAVERPLEAGLVREDGKVVYPVRDDIPVLLVEEGIPTDGL